MFIATFLKMESSVQTSLLKTRREGQIIKYMITKRYNKMLLSYLKAYLKEILVVIKMVLCKMFSKSKGYFYYQQYVDWIC